MHSLYLVIKKILVFYIEVCEMSFLISLEDGMEGVQILGKKGTSLVFSV